MAQGSHVKYSQFGGQGTVYMTGTSLDGPAGRCHYGEEWERGEVYGMEDVMRVVSWDNCPNHNKE